MKIVIVGAGIGGLSTYLFLKKHLLSSEQSIPTTNSDSQLQSDRCRYEIKIYDSYNIHRPSFNPLKPTQTAKDENEDEDMNAPVFTPLAIGSAIGISTNGLDVLRRMGTTCRKTDVSSNEEVNFENELLKRGHPINTWRMSNARGWTLANVNMTPKTKRELQQEDRRPGCDSIMISRQACWEILRDEVLKDSGVVEKRKVIDVVIGKGQNLNVVKFADGESEVADLVIGADGLRSVVRKAMFEKGKQEGCQKTANESSWTNWTPFRTKEKDVDYVTPQYEGLVGVGGFIPSSILSAQNHNPGEMSIAFGPNGFFGHGYITSSPSSTTTSISSNIPPPGPLAVYWSTFSSPSTPNPFPLAGQEPKPYAFDRTAALKALLSRHRSWKNPTIQAILDYAEQNGVEGFYPTWTTPELPTWEKNGRVVLVGDAAHALQPSSGQGASQAMEDAEGLGLLLGHYLGRDGIEGQQEVHLAKALKKYVELRKDRVHAIYVRSQQMSKIKNDMGLVMEMVMYFFIWIFSLLHDDFNEQLFAYDLPQEVERIVREE